MSKEGKTKKESLFINIFTDAAVGVAQWMLTEDAQKLILRGGMHSVLAGMEEVPYMSISTEELQARDIGVDWERAYHDRDAIRTLWTEKVTQ